MKKTTLRVLLAFGLLFGVTPARAASFGVPDSDTAILTSMLLNALKDSAQLGHLVTSAQQGLETAQATLAIARATTDAVGSMANLASNPDEIFNGVYSGFMKSFPEIEGITADALALKNSYEAGIFSGDPTYDPYALQKLMKSLKDGGDSALHTVVALDASMYNMTGENLLKKDELAFLREKTRTFMDKLFIADMAGGLSPQEAQVLNAQAAVSSMQAQVQAAESLDAMANIAKNNYMKGWDAATTARGNVAASINGLTGLIPQNADLNAFSDEGAAGARPTSDALTIGGE